MITRSRAFLSIPVRQRQRDDLRLMKAGRVNQWGGELKPCWLLNWRHLTTTFYLRESSILWKIFDWIKLGIKKIFTITTAVLSLSQSTYRIWGKFVAFFFPIKHPWSCIRPKIIPRTNLYRETASLPSVPLRFGENLQLKTGLESNWGECGGSKILWHKTTFVRYTRLLFSRFKSSISFIHIDVLWCPKHQIKYQWSE